METLEADAWLHNYLETFSEPMPHADIFHLHVKSKKEVFAEKPERLSTSDSTLYKLWDSRVKIPTKVCLFFFLLLI